ncbi:hypothetical protein EVAR_5454_1 [Eumeta japonica]|uniref:Uncharacterized protein n=1 Tax=Eumeta variegata TaxID=151549 RepID=A0A4C1T9S1_EUMVA|nr:hypothetical protein EVAR_5454_1 [Eumeta japonica]
MARGSGTASPFIQKVWDTISTTDGLTSEFSVSVKFELLRGWEGTLRRRFRKLSPHYCQQLLAASDPRWASDEGLRYKSPDLKQKRLWEDTPEQ